MSEWQTAAEFAANLNTSFRLNLDTPSPLELKLIEVKGHESKAIEPHGMERFSVFFSGPAEFFLPQRTYSLSHEKMGEFDIFLVPVGKEADGFRYEAVYNYFKTGQPKEEQEV